MLTFAVRQTTYGMHVCGAREPCDVELRAFEIRQTNGRFSLPFSHPPRGNSERSVPLRVTRGQKRAHDTHTTHTRTRRVVVSSENDNR